MTNTRSRDGIMQVSRIALGLAAAAALAIRPRSRRCPPTRRRR